MSLRDQVALGLDRLATAILNLKTQVEAIPTPVTVTDTKPLPIDADELIMLDSADGGNPVIVTKGQLLAGVTAQIGDIETILASI